MKPQAFDLTGKVALITGASRGLGQYLGRALARAGADLIITSRKKAALELDVRDHDSIQAMAASAREAFGRVDILVNNAGCNVRKRAHEIFVAGQAAGRGAFSQPAIIELWR